MSEKEDKRTEIAGVIGALPPIFVAMGQSGFFFDIPLTWGIPAILVGAVAAGLIQGRTMAGRGGYVVAWLVGGVGMALATVFYLMGRENILNLELVIPAAIGGAPGLGIGLAVGKWIEPEPAAEVSYEDEAP